MKHLGVSEQIDLLRPTVDSGLALRLRWWLLGIATVLVVTSLLTWHPVPLMFAVFFGVVGIAERWSGPNLVSAVRAFDEGTPSPCSVSITIVSGDTIDHYHAATYEDRGDEWTFEFIPQRWQPEEGSHPARIWRSEDGGPPVLVTVEGGILIPRDRPQRRSG